MGRSVGENRTQTYQIWIEEITSICSTCLPVPSFPVFLIQKVLFPRGIRLGHSLLLPNLLALGIASLLKQQTSLLAMLLRLTNVQHVDRRSSGAVHIWLVRVDIAVETGINYPFDNPESRAEAGGQLVANRVVKVVSKDQVVAVDRALGRELEADAVGVLVLVMRWQVEVR